MGIKILILLCFVLRNLLFDWDPASAWLELSVLRLLQDYPGLQDRLWSLLGACFASSAVSRLALPDDVSCDVLSLKNPPSRCSTASASPLVQLAMSSSSPFFPVLSTFDILEADNVCQVCL